jgi:sterol desaturase/sphingolipid hydroxylase (fatty acid hydroxylase superfamily)
MHIPSVFRIVHKTHHESLHPTVFTSFCFHPLEAVLQFLFFPLLILLLPIHYGVLFGVLMIFTVSALINHSGVEIFKRPFVLKHIIGSSHHELHHQEFKTNFGLHFTWWDKLMKTESKKTLFTQDREF